MARGTGRVIPIDLGIVKAFLVKGERPVLVDTGTPGNAERVLRALHEHGVEPRDVGLVIVTHSHADHTGSLAEIVAATGAQVAAHRLDAEYVRAGTTPPAAKNWLSRIMFRSSGKPVAVGVEPDILVDDALDLRPYGVPGNVIRTPGHTRGSVSVMMDSGEAVVGDLVLPSFMFFGPPLVAFWAASRQDSLASIRRILGLKPSTVLTSHGGPYRPQALAELVR